MSDLDKLAQAYINEIFVASKGGRATTADSDTYLTIGEFHYHLTNFAKRVHAKEPEKS